MFSDVGDSYRIYRACELVIFVVVFVFIVIVLLLLLLLFMFEYDLAFCLWHTGAALQITPTRNRINWCRPAGVKSTQHSPGLAKKIQKQIQTYTKKPKQIWKQSHGLSWAFSFKSTDLGLERKDKKFNVAFLFLGKVIYCHPLNESNLPFQ